MANNAELDQKPYSIIEFEDHKLRIPINGTDGDILIQCGNQCWYALDPLSNLGRRLQVFLNNENK